MASSGLAALVHRNPHRLHCGVLADCVRHRLFIHTESFELAPQVILKVLVEVGERGGARGPVAAILRRLDIRLAVV